MKFTRKLFFSALMAVAATGQAGATDWTLVYQQTFDDKSMAGVSKIDNRASFGLMGSGNTSGRYTSVTEYNPAAWATNWNQMQFATADLAKANNWKLTFMWAAQGDGSYNINIRKADGNNYADAISLTPGSDNVPAAQAASTADASLEWYTFTFVGNKTSNEVTMEITKNSDNSTVVAATKKCEFFNPDNIAFGGPNYYYFDEVKAYVSESEASAAPTCDVTILNESFDTWTGTPYWSGANKMGGGRYVNGSATAAIYTSSWGSLPLYSGTLNNVSNWELSFWVALNYNNNNCSLFVRTDNDNNILAIEATNAVTTDGQVVNAKSFGNDLGVGIKVNCNASGDQNLTWTHITLIGNREANTISLKATNADNSEQISERVICGYHDALKILTWAGSNNADLDEIQFKTTSSVTASVPVTSAGKATYCTSLPLDFSDVSDFTAYVATASTGSTVTMSPVTNAPANTGLYIVSSETLTETKSFAVPLAASTDAVSTNLLKGVLTATTVTQESGDNYNFFLTATGFNLASAGANNAGTTLAANKAYLQLPKSQFGGAARTLSVVFDDTATGISETEIVNRKCENGKCYDLQGRRVSNVSRPGIYVKNGKKLFIK